MVREDDLASAGLSFCSQGLDSTKNFALFLCGRGRLVFLLFFREAIGGGLLRYLIVARRIPAWSAVVLVEQRLLPVGVFELMFILCWDFEGRFFRCFIEMRSCCWEGCWVFGAAIFRKSCGREVAISDLRKSTIFGFQTSCDSRLV